MRRDATNAFLKSYRPGLIPFHITGTGTVPYRMVRYGTGTVPVPKRTVRCFRFAVQDHTVFISIIYLFARRGVINNRGEKF